MHDAPREEPPPPAQPDHDAATRADAEEAAEQRRRKAAEKDRARRAARIAAGLCRDCGKPRNATPHGTPQFCERCSEARLERTRAFRARKKEERAARGETLRSHKPRHGVCPHCRHERLTPHGRTDDGTGYRYLCGYCGRTSSGIVPLAPPDPQTSPCPYCHAPCRWSSAHRLKNGALRRRYRCTACHRYNTDLFPEPPLRQPGDPPLRHRLTIYLNPMANLSLIHYCNTRRMSAAQAIRDIFRRANSLPTVRVSTARATRDRDGRPTVLVTSPRPAPPPTPEETAQLARYRLPDLRPDVTRARARRTGEHRHAPTVLVSTRLAVRLDDAAKAGLLKEMRRTGRTHQEAARHLITHTRP